ncbi:histidine kinase [Myxococcota bacterium]|nr:histidine kinase [Myxococcota bacterium]
MTSPGNEHSPAPAPQVHLEHIAAIASISTAAPVVELVVTVPGRPEVTIHHGPGFGAAPMATPTPGSETPALPSHLDDGTRIAFRHVESLVTPTGESVGELRLFDVIARRLSVPQGQTVSRLARQAADLVALLRNGPEPWGHPPRREPTPPPPAPEAPVMAPDQGTWDALVEGVAVVDAQFAVRWGNQRALTQLGAADLDAGPAHLWDLVPEAVGGPFHAACLRARATGTTVLVEDWFPVRNRRVESRIVPRPPGFLLVMRDVTDERALAASLNAAQTQYRALSQRLRSAQEDERRRISRELHDVVGQDLSVIKLRLEMLKKRLTKVKARGNDANVLLCQDIIRDTENALAAARRLATDLRPSILDQLGLTAAIKWQAEELERRTGLQCRVRTHTADVREHTGRDTTAFRALQELLTNVLRHSDARRVDIDLSEDHGSLYLEVRDDGKGFPLEETSGAHASPPEALGLLGVRERVGALGGNVQIESKAGEGTRVRIALPPPPPEQTE